MRFVRNIKLPFGSHATALAALTAAGVSWGLTVPLSKLALEWLGPAWLTVGRFGVAAPLLALVARRRLRAALRPAVVGWGALGYGAVILVQNSGIERTSVSHAALIVGVVPVLVALFATALGRGRTGPLAWLGFALALSGVGLVAAEGGGSASAAGDGLVLLSVALSAAAVTAQPRLLAGRDPVAVTAAQLGVGALVALPAALALEGLPAAPPVAGWAFPAVVLLVTAGTLLPFTLFAYGQARIAPQLAGAFLNLEPLVGALAGAAAFGDGFGAVQLAGGLVLLGGIALSAIPRPARTAVRTVERRHHAAERIRPGARASFTRRSVSLPPAHSSRGRARPRLRADPESRGPSDDGVFPSRGVRFRSRRDGRFHACPCGRAGRDRRRVSRHRGVTGRRRRRAAAARGHGHDGARAGRADAAQRREPVDGAGHSRTAVGERLEVVRRSCGGRRRTW